MGVLRGIQTGSRRAHARLTASIAVIAVAASVVYIPPAAAAEPVQVMTAISNRYDDAEESHTGTMDLTSSDLEMTREGRHQTIGLRFDGLAVPPGAVVTNAYVQFQVDESSTEPTALRIYAEASDDPIGYSSTPGDITSRPRGTQTVYWNPAPWPAVGMAGVDQQTPDISSLVQEVVNRPGWAQGNAIALYVRGVGLRTAESFDGSRAPELHVTYEPGTGPVNLPPSVEASAAIDAGGPILFSTVRDDGLSGPLTSAWSVVSGPGSVSFDNPSAQTTRATFGSPGTYLLQLTVSDGEHATSDVAPLEIVSGAQPSQVTFAAVGDYGDGRPGQGVVASMIDSWSPEFIVTMGDNMYGMAGLDDSVGRFYSHYIGGYNGEYGEGSARNNFYPAMGNHDWEDAGGDAEYLAYFTLPGDGGNSSGNERFYDFVRGPVHFFIVSSDPAEPEGIDAGSAQATWLRLGLAASSSPWNVVVVHDAPYASGAGSGTRQWPFEEWGADLVMSGDSHQYERLQIGGIPYVVNGLGGAGIKATATPIPESQVYYNGDYGAMLLTACAESLTMEFVSISDGTIDSHTLGAPDCTTYAPPQGLAAVEVGSDVEVSWIDPDYGETGFEIERSIDGAGYAPIGTVGPDETTYVDSTVAAGVDVCYRVRSVVGAGGSDFSQESCLTTSVPNAVPIAVDDAAETSQGTPVSIDLVANDTDADLDPLLVGTLGTASFGAVTDNGDGTVTYTPIPGFVGSDSFTYTATDGSDESNTATVTVQVVAGNAAPVAVADSVTTDEDVSIVISVLSNDTDADGDPVSVQSVGQPSNGTTSLNPDGTVTYAPASDFSGEDTFTYTVTDGSAVSGPATVTVTVTPVNDAPLAADDAATTDEDVSVVIDVVGNDTDADGDPLLVGVLGPASSGTVVDNGNGTVTYTPDPDFNGVDSFTYTATDGTASSDIATVTVTVMAVNDAPVVADDSASAFEDGVVVIPIIANDIDPDGDALVVESVGQGSNGTVANNGDGTVTYTPNPDFNGVDSFTYTATDGTASSDLATVTVTVTAVNDAPVAFDDPASTTRDVAVVVDVLANDSDVDGDALSIGSFGQGADGTVTDNGDGTVTYTPDPGFSGVDTFTYVANDGTADSNLATVTVIVAASNEAPVAVDDSAATDEDVSVVIDVVGNDMDPDGDPMVIEALGSASFGSVIDNGNGTVTYIPDPDFNGADSFTYTVSDGLATSNFAVVTVDVAAVNDAPVSTDDTAFTTSDVAVVIDVLVNDSDVDGDGLAVGSFTQGSGGSVIDNLDGTLTYVPDPGFSGVDSFTYTVSDGLASSGPATVTVSVAATNQPPAALDDTATTDEDVAIVIDVVANDSDPNGDPLAVETLDEGANGAVVDNLDGTVTYTPDPDFNGVDTFTYTVSDGSSGSNVATVTVMVTSVNDAPVAVDDSATTPFDTPVLIAVTSNDVDIDGDTLSVGSFQGGNGTVSDNGDGTVTYTPAAGFSGTDTFTYTAFDGIVASNPATVVVTVEPEATPGPWYATSELTVIGSVPSGGVGSTVASDDVYEQLYENRSNDRGPNKTTSLDHRWTIDLGPEAGSSILTFGVEAFHTVNSEGDDFIFEYSTDGQTFSPLLTVTKTSDDDQAQEVSLPPGVSGSLTIRVVDADPATPGNRQQDSLYVDHLYVRSEGGGVVLPIVEVQSVAGTVAESGGIIEFRLTRSDSSGDLVVPVAFGGTAIAGEDYAVPPTSVLIAAGQTQVVVALAVLSDELVEGTETVSLTVLPGADHAVGPAETAIVSIADDDVSQVQFITATSQQTVDGSVLSGDLGATFSLDGAVLGLRETGANGRRSVLDHRWTFELGTSAALFVDIDASTPSRVERFAFEYSLDGTTWVPMGVLVDDTTSATQTYQFGPGVSGTVHVRVVDTDRSPKESFLDSVFIDRVVIRAG